MSTPLSVTVVGTGYVGLVSAACLAETGQQVIGLDVNSAKIACLRRGQIPIHEPGLEDLVKRNLGRRLRFTDCYEEAIPGADIVVIAVGTPSDADGGADLKYVRQVVNSLAKCIGEATVVAVKSTVPVGTCDEIEALLRRKARARLGLLGSKKIHIVSNPEFLREGRAISDFMKADRVVIGGDDPDSLATVAEMYEPLGAPVVVCDRRSSELVKYASNAFLATKISFINSIARLCDLVHADVARVSEGMGRDRRIMPEHLRAGLGYGGSCFPKDTAALLRLCTEVGFRFGILEETVNVNTTQVEWLVGKIDSAVGGLEGKTIAVWGLAFKPHTDDTRDAPAERIVAELVARGAAVQSYDPIAALPLPYPRYRQLGTKEEAISGAHALVVATEWPEFIGADFERARTLMASPVCIDGRNCLSPERLGRAGFRYEGIGRSGGEETVLADVAATGGPVSPDRL